MAVGTATVTLDLADYLGRDYDPLKVRVWLTTNVPGEVIVDKTGKRLRLNGAKVTVAADGTASFVTWVPGADTNPASWQTYVHIDAPGPSAQSGALGRPGVRTLGPFTITANTDLATLVQEQAVPPTYLSQVTTQLQQYVDQAQEYAQSGNPGPPGRSIVSIERTGGNGAPGTLDTYTITFSSGPTSTFQIRNGANGVDGTNTDPDALKKAQNLADLTAPATARTNLGLGTAATRDTGTTSGQVALLNANGRYDPARLGSGTTDATTVLYGDGSFKAAPSGGGGGRTRIGFKRHDPTTQAVYAASSTAFIDVDATNLIVTFTATSTTVDVLVNFVFKSAAAAGVSSYVNLRSGSTDVTDSDLFVARLASGATDSSTLRQALVTTVPGLTVGQSYTWKLGWRTSVAGQGNPSIFAGAEWGPVTMEVYA